MMPVLSANDTTALVIPIDTSKVKLKTFDNDAFEKYRNDPDYNYNLEPEYESSFLKKMFLQFSKWLASKRGLNISGGVLDLLAYVIIFFAIIMIIRTLAQGKMSGVFLRQNKKEHGLIPENIDANTDRNEINKLLDEAVTNQQYRVAVRLQFLRLLNFLNEKGKINWKAGKTNHDYLNELSGTALYDDFQLLNRLYEYTWYGEFEINSSDTYQSMRVHFEDFENKIGLRR